MTKGRVSYDSPRLYKPEHEPMSKVMLSQPPLPRRHKSPSAVIRNGTSNVPYSINGTLVVHINSNTASTTNSSNTTYDRNNGTTASQEQLNREFYRSYDPSIGLHTAAVLGGILIWLVLYVIYRTKVRKFVIRIIKRKFGNEEEFDSNKSIDSDNSYNGTNPNMVRPLINPSIVIETSPPESSPKSPSTYDKLSKPGVHDCLSPYSLHGGINEDGMVFQFPCPAHGSQYHLQNQMFQDQHDAYNYCQQHQHQQSQQHLQLPKSEMDIPTATAQWVQNMPLAARSYQDFAKLMLNMHNRGLQGMSKPCSCPHVSAAVPEPLPLLDLHNSWNKSLPVLSYSISRQLQSAYETLNNNINGRKDLKELLNAKRKMAASQKCGTEKEFDDLNPENEKLVGKKDSNKKHTLEVERRAEKQNHHRQKAKKKKSAKAVPDLTIKLPDATETVALLNNTSCGRSPVPIPVTPTVMIQNSAVKIPNRRQGDMDSNTSVSSSSSNDLLLGPPLPPPIQISGPPPSHSTLAYHQLLSPPCENRCLARNHNNNPFWWSHEDVHRSNSNCNIAQVRPASCSHSCAGNVQQCSFKFYKKRENEETLNPATCGNIRRVSSCSQGEQYFENVANANDVARNANTLSRHRRTMSDCNNYPFQERSSTPRDFHIRHQRSLSADVTYSLNSQCEQNSPTYSNGSNKNSIPASSPSPNRLQVPDPNGLRDLAPTLDTGSNFNHQLLSVGGFGLGGQGSTQMGVGRQPFVHSDTNITYFNPQFLPVKTPDNLGRRHSGFTQASADTNFLYCCDPSTRSASSCNLHNPPLPPHLHPHSQSSQQQQQQLQQLQQQQQQQQQQPQQQHLQTQQPHQHQHHRHHSTGTLGSSGSRGTSCLPPGVYMNKSYSGVIMETKL